MIGQRGFGCRVLNEDAALHAAWQADQALEAGDPDRLAFWKRVIEALEVLQQTQPLAGASVH